MKKEAKILLIVGLAALALGAIMVVAAPEKAAPSEPVDGSLLVREGTHWTGSPDAKVKIIEFGDFECPACAQAHPIMKQILTDYADNPDVSFAFRHFPLPQHRDAIPAAKAAEAAAAQGKFWEMYDLLYENQKDWSNTGEAKELFRSYAESLNLDLERFENESSGSFYNSVISADRSDADELGVNSTPTFFVNGQRFGNGIPSYTELKAHIDTLLAQ